MYSGATIFSQLMQQLPWRRFQTIVDHYRGDYKVQTFRCSEHFRVMAFAQLTYRESLRDIEACLRAEVLGSQRLTGALLDRLTHRVHILEANGESFRLQDSIRRRKQRQLQKKS